MNIKFVLLLFVSFSMKLCENTKTQTAEQDNSYMIEYTAHSRGMYEHITVSDSIISIQKDRDSKPVTKPYSKKDWEIITSILKNIDIKAVPKLKAPTEARFYDGAAIANLKITNNGTDYETPSFDHGSPPKEIEPLVKEILSIAENIE